jgi:peptide/nickel transport system permease protein
VYGLAGYSVVVETVFAWPGLGFLALQAVRNRDVVLVQTVVIVVAVLVVAVNAILDIVYQRIDPRIKTR